jgi:peptide/nickel transport system substrate-binding protein
VVRDRARRDLADGPRTLRRTAIVQTGTQPVAIAVGEGGRLGGERRRRLGVTRRPEGERSLRSISVGDAPSAIAIGDGAVWVANAQDDTVSRIDRPRIASSATKVATSQGHRDRGAQRLGQRRPLSA